MAALLATTAYFILAGIVAAEAAALAPARLRRRVRRHGTGLAERLECGQGWDEVRALVAAGPCDHGAQALSVLAHAAAVLGPPCLAAGCGLLPPAHPAAQGFGPTLAWLAGAAGT